MTDSKMAAELAEIRKAVEAQTAGLIRMLGALATQTAMLKEILAAVTAEPEGETPLVQALKQLIKIAEANSDVLERIENTIAKAGAR